MALPAYAIEMLGHILLFLLVFGMSATVDLDCVLKQMRNKRALGMGVFLQFIILPFLGFLTVKMLALDNAMGLTLLVVTSSPGGSYSNWWCSIFNADLALSVTMTAISTVLAVIMLPLNLYIYVPMIFNNDDIDVFEIINFQALMTSLIVVFAAIGLGIFASERGERIHPDFHIHANRFGSFAGVSLVMLSGIASNSMDGAKIWERDAKFYVGVAMPCVVALFISNILSTYSGLKKPERVTSCIECCYQNCGIATSVALSMFKGDDLAEAMGVPFFYGIVEFLLIGTYCLGAWKAGWTKAPPTEPFWKVVTTSYEVLLAEKLAQNRNIEVQLTDSSDGIEVTDEYHNEPMGGGFAAHCLYYCHEPDLAKAGSKSVDGGEAAKKDPEKEAAEVEEDGYVLAEEDPEMKKKVEKESIPEGDYVVVDAMPLFWRALGYKVKQ